MILFCNSAGAQKYEFDYLLEWETTTRVGTSNRFFFINSNNPDYRLLIFDKAAGKQYAWLEDHPNADKHVVHVFQIVVADPTSGKYRFIYDSSYKFGNYGHSKAGKLELDKIDHNFYSIAIFNQKKTKKPDAFFNFYVEESDVQILFNNMENPKYLQFQPLIAASLPKDKKYTITRYITKNASGVASDEKFIDKQKVALKLEVSPEKLKFEKRESIQMKK